MLGLRHGSGCVTPVDGNVPGNVPDLLNALFIDVCMLLLPHVSTDHHSPALQHAAPALSGRGGPSGAPGSSSSSSSVLGAQASAALSGLSSRLEASLASLGLRPPAAAAGGSRGAGGGLEGADPLEPFLGEWSCNAVVTCVLGLQGVGCCRRLWQGHARN
jgi:hypothetical protein